MTHLIATVLLALARLRRGGIIINEHTLTEAQTRFHVEVLSRWFDFISLPDLPARLRRPARKPFCLLTFDDGKRSNFSNAAPELERLGIPAVFYVPTDFLSNGSTLWFDRRNQLVSALGFCPIELETERLKRLPFEVVTERLQSWSEKYKFTDPIEDDDIRAMSWDEARSLRRRGFAFGAHGVTHAILTREAERRAFTEIEQSMDAVSRELGVRCDTFAFPNGNGSRDLARHAVKCGAATVMTTAPMWVSQNTPLCCLPRLQLFGSFSQAKIEIKIALAALRGALANPDGSGRRYRLGEKWHESQPGRLAGKLA
jgi:peptidoglycan/xylan/chitin deacetylase (PgdA/CDA1 family)